jgi:hypothetical protein
MVATRRAPLAGIAIVRTGLEPGHFIGWRIRSVHAWRQASQAIRSHGSPVVVVLRQAQA